MGSPSGISLLRFQALPTVDVSHRLGRSRPCPPGEYHVSNSRIVFCSSSLLCAVSSCFASNEKEFCGNLVAWNCGSGAIVQNTMPLRDVVAIEAGDIFSVALRRNGQVVAWGNPPNDPVEVSGGPWSQPYRLPHDAQFHTTVIAAGQEHGAALLADGTLIEWHQDVTPAHVIHPETHTDVIDLAAGGDGPIQDVWDGQPQSPGSDLSGSFGHKSSSSQTSSPS